MVDNRYLNVEDLDPDRVIILAKWVPDTNNDYNSDTDTNTGTDSDNDKDKEKSICLVQHRKICLLSKNNPEKYHAYCGYNLFAREEYDLPVDQWQTTKQEAIDHYEDDWDVIDGETLEQYIDRAVAWEKKSILNTICNPLAVVFDSTKEIDLESKYKDWTMYATLDNYATGFYLFIKDSIVHIYGRTNDIILSKDDYFHSDIRLFNHFISEYEAETIFVDKSTINEMTEFSGGYGSKFDGNTILLKLNNNNNNNNNNVFTYVHIGCEIFQFETTEEVLFYYSSVGNNCVPYPYAQTRTWCYDISSKTRSLVSEHPNAIEKGHVAYLDNVDYIDFPTIEIAPRDIDKLRHEASTTECTSMVKFIGETEFHYMKNTCADPTLPAVQELNSRLKQ